MENGIFSDFELTNDMTSSHFRKFVHALLTNNYALFDISLEAEKYRTSRDNIRSLTKFSTINRWHISPVLFPMNFHYACGGNRNK